MKNSSEQATQPKFTTPTWTLRVGNCQVTVSSRGGMPLSWIAADGMHAEHDQEIELLDGYRDQAELDEANGCRNALMAPWSNRIKDARYSFDGVEYDRGPAADGSREANHGLAMEADFTLVERHDSENESWLTIATTIGEVPGYPWRIGLSVTYTLTCFKSGSALTLEMEATNESEVPAPVGLGWHPYLCLGDVDELKVSIPAKCRIIPDETLIPLPGDAAFSESSPEDHEKLALKSQVLDQAWTELVASDDGVVRTVLTSPLGSTFTLEQHTEVETPGVGIVHLFTGDTLKHRPRESVAVEPCLFMTDAFNRQECATQLPLAPGQKRCLDSTLLYQI